MVQTGGGAELVVRTGLKLGVMFETVLTEHPTSFSGLLSLGNAVEIFFFF